MRNAFTIVIILLVLLMSIEASSQSSGARLIDEFGNLNSESATARLQYAVTELANQLEKHPDAMLQFINHRGKNQPLGDPYRRLGIQKAYLEAANYDLRRVIFSVCEPNEDSQTEIWLLDSREERRTCSPEVFNSNERTLFVTTYAPNYKYALGGCCLIDEVGYSASMEVVKAFGKFLTAHPTTSGYVVLYGGTNVYGFSIPPGPQRMVRRVDPPSFVSRLRNDVQKYLNSVGAGKSRVTLINGGYRDTYASIDLWIVPTGAKRPTATPDYFPRPRLKLKRKH